MKDINKMTLAEIKDHQSVNAEIEKAIGCVPEEIGDVGVSCDSPYQVGTAYFIRTVTFYYVGKLKELFSGELILVDASWIPDTGRYGDALKNGKFNEVERIPDFVIIPKSGIIDAVPWAHELPKDTK